MTNVFAQKILNTQDEIINQERDACIKRYGEECLTESTEPVYNHSIKSYVCPAFWDQALCWPATKAGETVTQSCPKHVVGFLPYKNATRYCTENGTWFFHEEINKTWSNYTSCFLSKNPTILLDLNKTKVSDLASDYTSTLKIISETGYVVSFITLIIAFIIMLSIRKLHCARNILHMHLFASFILRAVTFLIIAVSFEEGLGLPSDLSYQNGSLYYHTNVETNNWGCKLMTTLKEYFLTANYSWILMEGLYLHNLIFRALFVDSSNSIKWYVVMGWGIPLKIILCWVAVRLFMEDCFCWTTHESRAIYAIISVPTMLSILINLVLFVRISMVLFKKLRSPINEDSRRYQKWVKSTLVLVPLLGVHYALFLVLYSVKKNSVVELVWLFCNQFFGSFQGFIVAILYCFLNGEVKAELKPYLYQFLTILATNKCLKHFFPYRHRFLRSVVFRNSVCTTMSCSSLYTNGVFHHRNSKTRLDSLPKSKYEKKDHFCHNGNNTKSLQDIPRRNSSKSQPMTCETTLCIEPKPCQKESTKFISEEQVDEETLKMIMVMVIK